MAFLIFLLVWPLCAVPIAFFLFRGEDEFTVSDAGTLLLLLLFGPVALLIGTVFGIAAFFEDHGEDTLWKRKPKQPKQVRAPAKTEFNPNGYKVGSWAE